MGYYINVINGKQAPSHGKAQFIMDNTEATMLNGAPVEWQEGIVCVVDNGMFEAAGYCFSEGELAEFKRPDGRIKTWLLVPNAKELAQ